MRFVCCLLMGLLLLLCGNVMAQNSAGSVHGQITVNGKELSDTVSVVLLNAVNHAIVQSVFTDKKGKYHISIPKPGTYYLSISKAGYITHRSDTFKGGELAQQLPDIDLQSNAKGLKEVTVTDKKLFIENRPDKTVLNVSRGILTTGTSILDVLASAPGIKVDGNDALTFRGGQPPLVIIDGKNTHLSADDVRQMLRNMPSGDVEIVELYSVPPARFDAVGTGGVINIITKKGRNEGLNGNATVGGGYGNFGKANAGLNFNYRAKGINIFGNGSVGDNKSDQHINTDRLIKGKTEFDTRYNTNQRVVNPAYRLGIDFFVDSTQTIGALFNGSTQMIDYHKKNNSFINNMDFPDTLLNTTAGMSRKITHANYNLNYTGQLGKNGYILSADADYSYYHRTTDEDVESRLSNLSNAAINSTNVYQNYASTAYDIICAKADYSQPLGTGKFEAGFKGSFVNSHNTQQFDRVTVAGLVNEPMFSSIFNFTDRTGAVYGNYSNHNKGNTFNYAAGLRIENRRWTGTTVGSGNAVIRNFTNLYPSLLLNFKLTSAHRLIFNYSRRTDQPMYEDLNPVIAYQDRYNFRKGSDYLLPAYENMLQLTHVFKEKIHVSLSYSHISDFFSFVYFSQDDATKVFVTTRRNLKSATNYTLSFNTNADIAKWWNANFDVYVSRQRYVDKDGKLKNNAFDAMGKITNQFSLPKGINVLLHGQYEVPTDYAIYYYRASYFAKAAATKKLFRNRATVAFSVDDIFNTDRDRYSSTYSNLNMAGYSKRETRRFMLSFTCQFGKSTIKASRKHVNGDDEEQKRLGGGN